MRCFDGVLGLGLAAFMGFLRCGLVLSLLAYFVLFMLYRFTLLDGLLVVFEFVVFGVVWLLVRVCVW